ncbi:MAG: TIM barrel protein [Spirochaetia bacterium]|jgi:2-keto-myo-inositol isomerase|nr:TIM barrel protein [Spirochaetia bacterium]
MLSKNFFSLNRIISPALSIKDFIELTADCGLKYIELRNDLGDGNIIDHLKPGEVKKMCGDKDISIAAVNAIQKFNLPSNFRKAEEEIKRTAELCAEISCKAIILCPSNDTSDKRTREQFMADTAEALSLYAPVFKSLKITGLIEPLGFSECSIRGKKEAIKAIALSGSTGCTDPGSNECCYKVVHDSFHHYLGGDEEYFPHETGLIHISGVDNNIPDNEMRDCHRVLVTEKDRIGNKKQIREMDNQGYKGIISFEPFSDMIQKIDNKRLKTAISESIRFILDK